MDTEKRYQVFVSSTFLDLIEPRQAVVATLLGLDAFPAGMELFPAADDDAWTLIEDVISDSDYYLLIIGGKYGSVDPDLEISFTEREFDTAVAKGKPVMAFLHGEPGKLLAEQTEESPSRRKKLDAFRKKVESSKHVKYWMSAEDLAGKVALSWNQFKKRYPATGWVRADQVTSQESLRALTKAQAEIEVLKTQLHAARTEAPAGTDKLAQGTGSFELSVYVDGVWTPEGSYRHEVGTWHETMPTWDRVFGYLGLRMMQEGSHEALKEDLELLIRSDYECDEVFRDYLHEVANEDGVKKWSYRFQGVTVTDEDFQTVILQLVALGLVEQSQRNRSVKDTSNYWSLTPYGHTKLVQIRALKAGEQSLRRDTMDPAEESTEDDLETNKGSSDDRSS